MSTSPELIAREVHYTHACCIQSLGITPSCEPDELIRAFTKMAAHAQPLSSGERGIITLLKPKSAALFTDRVWLPFAGKEPELKFTFGWVSPVAVRLSALFAFMSSNESTSVRSPSYSPAIEPSKAHAMHPRFREFLIFTEGDLVADYARITGALVAPLYASSVSRNEDYRPGNHEVVTSVIENVAVVSEDDLTWEQVIEFRKDKDSRAAYRQFVHWLDKEMVGRPAAFVVDEVSHRLENYRWALKKHGLQTVFGTLEQTLDAKDLIGASVAAIALASFTQTPIASALGGAGVLVGKAAIRVGTQLIERKEIVAKNREVAFVHHLAEQFAPK